MFLLIFSKLPRYQYFSSQNNAKFLIDMLLFNKPCQNNLSIPTSFQEWDSSKVLVLKNLNVPYKQFLFSPQILNSVSNELQDIQVFISLSLLDFSVTSALLIIHQLKFSPLTLLHQLCTILPLRFFLSLKETM